MKIISACYGGIQIALLWIIIFFIIILVGVFTIDVYYTNVKAEIAKDAVTMAALSVYKSIDISQLESGDITLNEQIISTFKTYLAKNMKLNNDLSPRPNSIAVSQVEIEEFIIYKKDSNEKFYPDGNVINYKPSLYVKIKYDIEPMLKGIVGHKKTVYTSATADLISDNQS